VIDVETLGVPARSATLTWASVPECHQRRVATRSDDRHEDIDNVVAAVVLERRSCGLLDLRQLVWDTHEHHVGWLTYHDVFVAHAVKVQPSRQRDGFQS
jgi:hypothetical protein